jgi:hypothetical protein
MKYYVGTTEHPPPPFGKVKTMQSQTVYSKISNLQMAIFGRQNCPKKLHANRRLGAERLKLRGYAFPAAMLHFPAIQ